jgi:hypothetical protein
METMDVNYVPTLSTPRSVSKKRLSEVLQLKLANSLDEYHLKGKKFKNTLEKASKAFASMIAKQDRKKKKAKE